MESVWVLVGEGENELRIPCMFFKSEKDAREYLKEKLSIASESNYFDLYNHYDSDEEKMEEALTGTILASAYFGCGGCWALTLEERKFGEIFIHWDLD